MTDRLVLEIVGRNGSRQVFAEVTADAQRMGQSVEQSGQRAGRSLADLRRNAVAVGGAIGTLAGGMAVAGTAAANQERQVDALRRVYGESATQILDFSRAIQENTNFSDEQARQAALTAATLQRSYGLSVEATQALIERSADLAQVYGIDLADAVSRTSAALRGEGEAAELLGLTLSDSAVAAEAAARGLSGWTTTMTEAEKAAFRYQLLMEQSADVTGAAADAADGARGTMIDLTHRFQDATVAVGEFLGPMGEAMSVLGSMALVLPAVGAGLGKLGGLGAVPVLAAGAALAGSGYLTYDVFANRDQAGTSVSNSLFGTLAAGAAGLVKTVTPGSYGDALFEDIRQQYLDIINSAEFEEAARLALLQPFESQHPENLYNRLGYLIGAAPGTMTPQEIEAEIQRRATAGGYQSAGQYILETAAANPNFVQDPRTGAYIPVHVWQEQQRQQAIQRTEAIAAGATTYVGSPGTGGLERATGTGLTGTGMEFSPGSSGLAGAAGMVQPWDQQAADLKAYRAELERTYGAYAGMVEGLNNANDAQEAFWQSQQNVLQEQGVYNQQIGEYTSQQNALTDAYEVLQERQAAGVQLTEEEQALLDNYPRLYERITGGVDDATVAAGLLAAAYIENMEKGDAMNRALEESTGATGELVDAIELLILSLAGVPEEVKTQLRLERAGEDIEAYKASLAGIPRYIPVVIDTIVAGGGTAGAPVIDTGPGGGGSYRGYAHGGVVAEMGEAGAELLRFRDGGMGMAARRGLYTVPQGTYVTPAPETRRQLAGIGGGGLTINNPVINVYPATGDVEREFTSAIIGEWRR